MKRGRFLRSGSGGSALLVTITVAGLMGCNVTITPPHTYVYAPPPVYVAPPPAAYVPAPVAATAQPAAAPAQVDPAIQDLVAPIALYPDPLLAVVLPASTYPQQVQDANTWVQANPAPSDADVDQQQWDPSVKALVRYPTVLAYMSTNITWTTNLGGAVTSNQAEVMEAVQNLRAQAVTQGNLVDNSQITVLTQGPTICIQPTDANMIYVPTYDPAVVFTTPNVVINFGTIGFVTGPWLIGEFDWVHWGFFYGHWHDWHGDWRGGPGHWDHFRHDYGHRWGHDPRWGSAPRFDRRELDRRFNEERGQPGHIRQPVLQRRITPTRPDPLRRTPTPRLGPQRRITPTRQLTKGVQQKQLAKGGQKGKNEKEEKKK